MPAFTLAAPPEPPVLASGINALDLLSVALVLEFAPILEKNNLPLTTIEDPRVAIATTASYGARTFLKTKATQELPLLCDNPNRAAKRANIFACELQKKIQYFLPYSILKQL